jgi:hypothetical protein
MRSVAAVLGIVALLTAPVAAQGRGRRSSSQGIPPGHLPPSGQCRVWYEGRPPGHQPPPVNCREAERIAARDPYARVIYGSGSDRADQRRPRAVPRQDPSRFPNRYPTARRGENVYTRVAFRSYDVQRHSRYRSADRGYDDRYGSRDEYRNVYRDGFQVGYDEGYRGSGRAQDGFRLPWPF